MLLKFQCFIQYIILKISNVVAFHLPTCLPAVRLSWTSAMAPVFYTTGNHVRFTKILFRSKFVHFCKHLFIVHIRVKGLVKVMLQYRNEAPQLQKWAWHMYNEILSRLTVVSRAAK